MSKKQFHLELIQSVINRLGRNSFLLKGWSVILVSAMFALSANNSNSKFSYLAFFPAIAFWVLDGYFLYIEKLYRNLFDYVRNLNENKIDFSMNYKKHKLKTDSWIRKMFSLTLGIFHGMIILSIIIITIIINCL